VRLTPTGPPETIPEELVPVESRADKLGSQHTLPPPRRQSSGGQTKQQLAILTVEKRKLEYQVRA